MKEVVLDIETQNTFQEVGEYNPSLLKVSLVGVYFYETDTYESFLEHELSKLWPRLERADRVIGYNINGFDFPVLQRYYPGKIDKIPVLDLMVEIAKTLGYRCKLDDVAHGTLGIGKSGNGLQAIEWWKKGEIDKIREYCLMDVKVTKEVYEAGKRDGLVTVMDKRGSKVQTQVNFLPLPPAKTAINFSLPF